MRNRPCRVGLVLLGLVACNPAATEPASTESAIVGGNLEPTRHPAVGYLVFRLTSGPHAGEIFRPDCGAVLIEEDVVVTAAHCVESETAHDRDVIAVGFGDGNTGPTYAVRGTWRDWVNPKYLVPRPWGPGGAMVTVADSRHDVALLALERTPGLAPMPLARRSPRVGEGALVIGYGRVQTGNHEDIDDLAIRPDHRDRYPGLRKSADLEITRSRDSIDAYPKPTTAERRSGGICFADSGSALILDDGSIAGVLAAWPDEDNAAQGDGVPLCREDNGGKWANLHFPSNASFVDAWLANHHTSPSGAVR